MHGQSDSVELLEQLAAQLTADLEIGGLAVGVTVNGVTAHLCRGELMPGEPVTIDTEFYAVSLTKQFIGALAAIAIEQGRLAYDTRVAERIAGLPGWMDEIRVRHLLHHTSGIPEITDDPERWPVDNAALLNAVRATTGAVDPPGTRFSYSNTGYVLLAETLADAFARLVEESMRELFFVPLGIGQSRLGGPAKQIPSYVDPPGTIGDGGLWTTIVDLQRWLVALDERRLPDAVRRIEESGTLDDGTSVEYGWGLGTREIAGYRAPIHGGGWPGWTSKVIRLPEQGVAIAILTHGATATVVGEAGDPLTHALLRLRRDA